MNLTTAVDKLLKRAPQDYGKSRIQAVLAILETGKIPQPPAEKIPKDLWEWVLANPGYPDPCVEAPRKNLITLEDFMEEQIYLGARVAHYRPIWTNQFGIDPAETILCLPENVSQGWKKDLLPALFFLATHPSKPNPGAGYALLALQWANPEELTAAYLENKKSKKTIKGEIAANLKTNIRGAAKTSVTPLKVLSALGWDTQAHKDDPGFPEATADIALNTYKEIQGMKQIERQNRDAQSEFYFQILKNTPKIQSLPISKKLLKKATSDKIIIRRIQGMLRSRARTRTKK